MLRATPRRRPSQKAMTALPARRLSAMRDSQLPLLGGTGETVGADETFIGRKDGATPSRGTQHKRAVLSLVECGGSVRSFHIDKANLATIGPIVMANVAHESALMTGEARHYRKVGKRFAAMRPSVIAPKNTCAAMPTYAKRFLQHLQARDFKGIYQHCGEKPPASLP